MNPAETEAIINRFETLYAPVVQELKRAIIDKNVTPELVNKVFMMLSRIREVLPFITDNPDRIEEYRKIYKTTLSIIARVMNGEEIGH